MDKNDLIYRNDLLAAYDAAHKGPPGNARKLIAEAPAIDAVPVDFLLQFQNEPILCNGICNIIKLWQKRQRSFEK